MELEEMRHRWVAERPEYERLGLYVRNRLSDALSRKGLKGYRIEHRAKTVASLVKKFVRKRYSDYEEVTDKLGIRIVVSFTAQLDMVEETLHEVLDVSNRDNKSDVLEPDKTGYISIHFDATIKATSAAPETSVGRPFEVQVRSLCQDVWANMAHTLLYKPSTELPRGLARRVYSLSALLEICDREFGDLYGHLQRQPGGASQDLLTGLEESFYRFTYGEYDPELSLEVLQHLMPLWGDLSNPSATLSEWSNGNAEALESIYTMYQGARDRWVFLYQPESILLFYFLEAVPLPLCDLWTSRFPDEELRGLASVWGASIDPLG